MKSPRVIRQYQFSHVRDMRNQFFVLLASVVPMLEEVLWVTKPLLESLRLQSQPFRKIGRLRSFIARYRRENPLRGNGQSVNGTGIAVVKPEPNGCFKLAFSCVLARYVSKPRPRLGFWGVHRLRKEIRFDAFDIEPIDQERPDKLKDFIPDAFRNNLGNRVDVILV